jgi:flagellar assembly protein FliH
LSRIIKAAELQVLIPNESHTIIPAPKSEELSPDVQDGTILDASNLIEDAQVKAREILERAEQEAEALKANTEQELEAIRLRSKEKGYEEGYEEGWTVGQEKAGEKAASFLAILEETVQSAVRVRANSLAQTEEDFLKFSLILAEKIVRNVIEDDLSWLEPIVKEAISRLGSVEQVIVRLNPQDYHIVQSGFEDLKLSSRTEIFFEPDNTLSKGSCIIDSENGAVDARLEKRVGKLGHSLMEVLYDAEI